MKQKYPNGTKMFDGKGKHIYTVAGFDGKEYILIDSRERFLYGIYEFTIESFKTKAPLDDKEFEALWI